MLALFNVVFWVFLHVKSSTYILDKLEDSFSGSELCFEWLTILGRHVPQAYLHSSGKFQFVTFNFIPGQSQTVTACYIPREVLHHFEYEETSGKFI
jgi:hypothetical protein